MKKNINGRWFEVIEIIPKKYREQDLFVCKNKYGYKECFQRMDVEGNLTPDKRMLRWRI